jgi:hypothetical protein
MRRMWMAATAAALLLATHPPTAAAAGDDVRLPREGKAYFVIGWSGIDVTGLNDALGTHGYDRFGTDFLSIGGAGHASFRRFVIGGQGYGLWTRGRDVSLVSGPFRSRLRGGAGFLDLGAVALRRGRTSLTGLVGLGGGSAVLDVVDRSTTSFDGAIADPRLSMTIRRSAFLIDLGATLDTCVPTWHSIQGQSGPAFGVRAGYVFAPAEGDWTFDNRGLSGGPDAPLTGPYVRLLLGFGAER